MIEALWWIVSIAGVAFLAFHIWDAYARRR